MYSIQKAQALDYLLKVVLECREGELNKKNLKLAINIDGILLCGDFIQICGQNICQPHIDHTHTVELQSFSVNEASSYLFFNKVYAVLDQYLKKNGKAIRKNKYASFLFHSLVEVVNDADLDSCSTPLFPYLLNASSLDGKIKLPFINLAGEDKIKIISVVEAP